MPRELQHTKLEIRIQISKQGIQNHFDELRVIFVVERFLRGGNTEVDDVRLGEYRSPAPRRAGLGRAALVNGKRSEQFFTLAFTRMSDVGY
jgi:hypothetical protein